MNTQTEEIYAYKFSSTAKEIKPDILAGKSIEDFLKGRYDNPHSFGLDHLHESACYKLGGWSFDFSPYLTLYVVKQYGSWQQYYAPNKTMLRKSLYGKLDKIVEVI